MYAFDLTPVLLALAELILGVLVLVAARFVRDLLSPYSTDRELTDRDNPAFGLAISGYYSAVSILFIAVARSVAPPVDAGSAEAARALALDFGWSLVGIAGLSLSRWLMNVALLGGGRFSESIVSERNTACGAVECGVYLAAGITVAGVLRQPGGTILTGFVLFLLSQAVLLIFGRIYAALAGYNIVREIRTSNTAAGVAFGFTLVAFSLLLAKATSGEFVDWTTNLGYFAFDAIGGFVLLLLLRWLTDFALLPNARIAEEIARDRNVNGGLIEGVIAVGIAAFILYVF